MWPIIIQVLVVMATAIEREVGCLGFTAHLGYYK